MTERDSARSDPLPALRNALRTFALERDWDQFHSPRNLAAALCVEAAELLELFQWLTDESSKSLSSEQLAKAREELADVFLYLIRLADKLNVDLVRAAEHKIALNAQRYPIDKVKGSSRKYTDL